MDLDALHINVTIIKTTIAELVAFKKKMEEVLPFIEEMIEGYTKAKSDYEGRMGRDAVDETDAISSVTADEPGTAPVSHDAPTDAVDVPDAPVVVSVDPAATADAKTEQKSPDPA